jgi:putative pyruvate formate lyase activating enzyme
LVLPNDLAGTARISDFVAELSTNTYYNLMDQYHPDFQAYSHADLHRRTSLVEFNQAKTYAKKLGLNRLAR